MFWIARVCIFSGSKRCDAHDIYEYAYKDWENPVQRIQYRAISSPNLHKYFLYPSLFMKAHPIYKTQRSRGPNWHSPKGFSERMRPALRALTNSWQSWPLTLPRDHGRHGHQIESISLQMVHLLTAMLKISSFGWLSFMFGVNWVVKLKALGCAWCLVT